MMRAYYVNLSYIILLPIMKLIAIALIAVLAACAEKPKPLPPKSPTQFIWMTVPGTLEDAERMGFVCQPAPGDAEIRCVAKNVDVLGVAVDAALTISVKNGITTYDAIELITRWATGWERSCDSVDVDIVMLDGSIKKTAQIPCVRDTRNELDAALIRSGWNKVYDARHTVYTNNSYGAVISVYMGSLVFKLSSIK